MKRREFIAGLGMAATLPLPAFAQKSPLPVVGFLSSRSPGESEAVVSKFREGLGESGYVIGENVLVDYRWAEGRYERLATLAGEPFFDSQRSRIVALVTKHGTPAMYSWRENVALGGLISYGSSLTDSYRKAGVYTGRILKGEKPADLPVMQPTKFELAINLKTAKTLGIAVPPTLLARADEVIE